MLFITQYKSNGENHLVFAVFNAQNAQKKIKTILFLFDRPKPNDYECFQKLHNQLQILL